MSQSPYKPKQLQALLQPGQTWTTPEGQKKMIIGHALYDGGPRFHIRHAGTSRSRRPETEIYVEWLAVWIVRTNATLTAGYLKTPPTRRG